MWKLIAKWRSLACGIIGKMFHHRSIYINNKRLFARPCMWTMMKRIVCNASLIAKRVFKSGSVDFRACMHKKIKPWKKYTVLKDALFLRTFLDHANYRITVKLKSSCFFFQNTVLTRKGRAFAKTVCDGFKRGICQGFRRYWYST